jgi:hypothetical protein
MATQPAVAKPSEAPSRKPARAIVVDAATNEVVFPVRTIDSFMHDIGSLKNEPSSIQELFFTGVDVSEGS